MSLCLPIKEIMVPLSEIGTTLPGLAHHWVHVIVKSRMNQEFQVDMESRYKKPTSFLSSSAVVHCDREYV